MLSVWNPFTTCGTLNAYRIDELDVHSLVLGPYAFVDIDLTTSEGSTWKFMGLSKYSYKHVNQGL